VAQARLIRSVIGLENLRKILDYLVRNYWQNYCGWSDLIVHRPGEWFFVEVKSSKDRLSEDQKRWMLDNQNPWDFFRIFKIAEIPRPW